MYPQKHPHKHPLSFHVLLGGSHFGAVAPFVGVGRLFGFPCVLVFFFHPPMLGAKLCVIPLERITSGGSLK